MADFNSSWNIFLKSDQGETNVPVKLEMIIPPTTTPETPGTTPNKTRDPNELPTSVKLPEERCCECPGKGPYQNIAGLIYTQKNLKLALPSDSRSLLKSKSLLNFKISLVE